MSPEAKSIEALKRKLIVSEDEFLRSELEPLIHRVRGFCVLDEGGVVHLRRRDLSRRIQLGLCLAARLLGSRLDQAIAPTLSAAEAAAFLGAGKAEAVARAKELVDQGYALRAGKGTYRMNAARLEDFLATLEGEQSEKEVGRG